MGGRPVSDYQRRYSKIAAVSRAHRAPSAITVYCPTCGQAFLSDEKYKEHWKAKHQKKENSAVASKTTPLVQ